MEQNGNFSNTNNQNVNNNQYGNAQNQYANMKNQYGNTQSQYSNPYNQYSQDASMNNHEAMLNGQVISTDKMAAEMEKQENVGRGILGAVIGALIGVAFMVIMYLANYVSFYTGLIMGICSVYGYEKASGRFSKKGIIIGTIVSILMVYVGARLCFAIELTNYYTGYNVFEAFIEVDEKVAKHPEVFSSGYYSFLGQQYLFAGLGILFSIFSNISKKKKSNGESGKGIGAFKKSA